jgi:hypothetical protein
MATYKVNVVPEGTEFAWELFRDGERINGGLSDTYEHARRDAASREHADEYAQQQERLRRESTPSG